jgi:long-subunit fatty acid transport protein
MLKHHNLTLISLLLSASAPIFGAAFLTSGGSARSAGMAGTYTPDTTSVLDAIAINPAGLALVSAPVIDLTLAGGLATGNYTNSVSSTGNLHTLAGSPYGAFGSPLGHRISIGVAVLPELFSAAKWNYTDPTGSANGVSYGALHSISSIKAARTALGAGIYLSSRVQIGATIGYTHNSNELDTAYIFQNFAPLAGLKTLLTLHTSGNGWNGTGGVLVRASKTLQVGAAFHSRTTIRSTGSAYGNAGVQFAAIGLGAARPDFHYNAEVDNVLPQSVTAHINWQATSKLQFVAQADWINWSRAFQSLPVILTHGDNSDINGLLGSSGINDSIPLHWKDQVVARLGVSRKWNEHGTLRAGYAHANSPVPGSTLSPLTAAITRHTLSAGAGYARGRWSVDAAYSVDPSTGESSGKSLLKSSEFDNTHVGIMTQAVILSTTFRL